MTGTWLTKRRTPNCRAEVKADYNYYQNKRRNDTDIFWILLKDVRLDSGKNTKDSLK